MRGSVSMPILWIFILWIWIWIWTCQPKVSLAQFSMYYTDRVSDDNNVAHDCLLFPVMTFSFNKRYWDSQQIISYCIRFNDIKTKVVPTETPFTFANLYKRNISVQMLSLWSAPIDVLEHYAHYLANTDSISLSQQLFYNCSLSWFGEFCQYTFDLDSTNSFVDIVKKTFAAKEFSHYIDDISSLTNYTCYEHLQCYRGPGVACLDWREICDEKIDCLGEGQDEAGCFELEMNECNENEYRCRNGQCIPKEFYRDNPSSPDCMDKTDEILDIHVLMPCVGNPSFRCEESTCSRPGYFHCGDGDCIENMLIGSRNEPSCGNQRAFQLARAMILANTPSLSENCSIAVRYYSKTYDLIAPSSPCLSMTPCQQTPAPFIKQNCPSTFEFPISEPILMGHVHFVYTKNFTEQTNSIWIPDFICYNEQFCPFLPFTVSVKNLTCRHVQEMGLQTTYTKWQDFTLAVQRIFRLCSTAKITDCDRSKGLFRCKNSSKCISTHRLLDGNKDCFFSDDELFNDSCSVNDKHRFNCTSTPAKCISFILANNWNADCPNAEDEPMLDPSNRAMIFPLLCDRVNQDITMPSVDIDDHRETDETNCDWWPCNNPYTRCDRIWNCPTGADELNCLSPSPCPINEHMCVSPITFDLTCLPLNQINDGVIDCLGAFDEREFCRKNAHTDSQYRISRYRCMNTDHCIPVEELCHHYENPSYCNGSDVDKRFCHHLNTYIRINTSLSISLPCGYNGNKNRTLIESLLCNLTDERYNEYDETIFSLEDDAVYPVMNSFVRTAHSSTPSTPVANSWQALSNIDVTRAWYCNRGILVYKSNMQQKTCLCPPSYYGKRCEYQSQRVGLTLQLQALLDRSTVFRIAVFLIDDLSQIHSYEQIMFLPIRDCNTKFNIYFLYQSQPKEINRNYSVQVDAFSANTLTYRTSWLFPQSFSFLPVHRLTVLLMIPTLAQSQTPEKYCPTECQHGQCQQYENRNEYFCHCSPGYSSKACSIKLECDCAPNSICLGSVDNRSICMCPIGQFGPKCYLSHSACQSNPCANGGTCIPAEERIDEHSYMCRCSSGYSGEICELIDTRIDISFESLDPIPQFVWIHYLVVGETHIPLKTSLFMRIPFDQQSITLYVPLPFHLIVVEIDSQYYLTLVQKTYTPSSNITISVLPSQRCKSNREFFNATILQYPAIRRVKYYQLPCQSRLDLSCFHDEKFMCLCNRDRFSNCFEFNPNIKTSLCRGLNYCENEGQCYEDESVCPQMIACVCSECFYGIQCQLSSKGFSLSLDAILGYQVQPNIAFSHQPLALKLCVAWTVCMLVFGLVNGIFSFITFKRKKILEVGCGLYLLVASINSLLTTMFFALKFWFLVASHMGTIINQLFLWVTCISLDFFLRILLTMNGWLNTCVTVERALNLDKGVYFNAKRSKQVAKYVILVLVLVIVTTTLHDPINRHLTDDVAEQRTWCITRYSSSVQIFDSVMQIFHSVGPFIINLISAFFIIFKATRQRFSIRKKQTYRQHLREQFEQLNHLIISPLILVSLEIPRIIISFLSGCLKSPRDPWLFLGGYLLSLLPPMLTFFIFVLPSKSYKMEFTESLRQVRLEIRRRLDLE